jgi:hypothetical protein
MGIAHGTYPFSSKGHLFRTNILFFSRKGKQAISEQEFPFFLVEKGKEE